MKRTFLYTVLGLSIALLASCASQNNNKSVNYKEKTLDINLEMIYVEGGKFMMGGTEEQDIEIREDELPVHEVTLDGFYIGKFEITQAQWKKIMGTTLEQQRDRVADDAPLKGEGRNYPMYYVNWDEAMEFCRVLSEKTGKNYTLPTEAQWEYAARGGQLYDECKYSGSTAVEPVAWYNGNSDECVHPCGTKQANELGIFDLSGNVWEWCLDWYSNNYNSAETLNPQGPENGSARVNRGGAWSHDAHNCRVADRDHNDPAYRTANLGFRVVMIP